jgi:hypothetical protein
MANHELKKTGDVGLGPKASGHTMVLDRSNGWPKRINDGPDCAFSLPPEQLFPPSRVCGPDTL